MYFDSEPSDFTPINSGLIFTIGSEEEADIEAVIVNVDNNIIAGRLKLFNVSNFSFDIAPYIKSPSGFTHEHHGSSRFSEIPTNRYRVEIYRQGSDIKECSSRVVTISCNGIETDYTPFIPTTMGESRQIARNELDHICIYSTPGSVISARITSDAGDEIDVERSAVKGALNFIFSAADLASNAQTATVTLYADDEEFATYNYTINPIRKSGVRLAWCSTAGSIEFYTFPIAEQITARVSKNTFDTGTTESGVLDGIITKQMRLVSDFETKQVLDPLSEIIAASKVWILSGNMRPVSVTNTELQLSSNQLGRIKIDIIYDRKEVCR